MFLKIKFLILISLVSSTAMAQKQSDVELSEIVIALQSHAMSVSSLLMTVSIESDALPAKKQKIVFNAVRSMDLYIKKIMNDTNKIAFLTLMRNSAMKDKITKESVLKRMIPVLNDFEFCYVNFATLRLVITNKDNRKVFEEARLKSHTSLRLLADLVAKEILKPKTNLKNRQRI